LHEDVRAWTIQLALEDRAAPASFLQKLAELARRDPSPVVRLYLASALQRLAPEQRWEIAAGLLARGEDATDPNIPTVLWYGIEPLVVVDATRALKLAVDARLEPLPLLLWRRCASGATAEREALVAAMADAPAAQTIRMLLETSAALREKPGSEPPAAWKRVSPKLLGSPDAGVREAAAQVALAFGDVNLAPLFRARLADVAATPEARCAALEGLAGIRDTESAPLVLDALADAKLRASALRALAAWELDGAPQRILQNWEGLGAGERELALAALTSRAPYAREFLATIAAGHASPRLLDSASLRRQLAGLHDAETDRLLGKAWGRSVPPSAGAAADVARYKTLLTDAYLSGADLPHGRALFARTCVACHTLFAAGGTLGPDLTGGNRGDLDFLLANIVDPSAEMGREYQMTTAYLKDGRVLAGTVVAEDAERLTLRTATGDVVLLLRDVKKDAPGQPGIERSQVSLMPPGQLQALQDAEVRDLIAYLRSPRQTLLAAAPETLPYFFDGRTLTGWEADPAVWSVENGEIVGRSPQGLAQNSFARSSLRFRDFRLIVDVLLADDSDNGGIQFRSEGMPEGEVRGYQADVGAGWWGKLYEEHGRGLLTEAGADDAVRPGDWVTYEIVAARERVLLSVNGKKTAELADPQGAREGILALQLHSGGPAEIRFRNFRFELDPQPVLKTAR
jgi:putative heme-binding domain-containing protein